MIGEYYTCIENRVKMTLYTTYNRSLIYNKTTFKHYLLQVGSKQARASEHMVRTVCARWAWHRHHGVIVDMEDKSVFTIARVYSDADGESHFDTFQIKMNSNGKNKIRINNAASKYWGRGASPKNV